MKTLFVTASICSLLSLLAIFAISSVSVVPHSQAEASVGKIMMITGILGVAWLVIAFLKRHYQHEAGASWLETVLVGFSYVYIIFCTLGILLLLG